MIKNSRNLMLMFCLLVLSYAAGYQVATKKKQASTLKVQAESPAVSVSEIEELRQQLVNKEVAAEVDRLSIESLRQELVDVNQTLDFLREENNFYKRLMQPEDDSPVVGIHTFKVFSIEGDPLAFKLEILVQQTASSHKLIDSRLGITVKGFHNQQPASFPLQDLIEGNEQRLELHFRYFQTISATFRLPEGFSPVDFLVDIPVGRDTVQQHFSWRVESPLTKNEIPSNT